MTNNLEGKQAVVTGGTGGIGAEVVRQLTKEGCKVISVALEDEETRQKLADETGAQCLFMDVTDRAEVMKTLGRVDCDFLVAAAGALGQTGTLYDQPAESAQRLVDVNILGVQNCLQAVVPSMLKRNDGHVLFVGSVALYPSQGQPIYSATKAAVHSMAQNLRMEVYPHNIRVTEFRPGRVRSGMHAEMFGGSHDEANKRVYDPVTTMSPAEAAKGIVWVLNQPPHLCVAQLEVMATEHVIGGVRYKGM